jgi:hypothetical protein
MESDGGEGVEGSCGFGGSDGDAGAEIVNVTGVNRVLFLLSDWNSFL